MSTTSLVQLQHQITRCALCPRLVAHREQVAREKVKRYRDWEYWGRPVPSFGDPRARLLIIGLAPAAHGGNRTGRMFTGDRSGDWLYAALHRAGLASQPTSTGPGDGLTLHGVRITAPVHCAPPANRPTTQERDTCRPWLERELSLLAPTLRVFVVLGAFGWSALWSALAAAGHPGPVPRPAFGHGAEVAVPGRGWHVLGCYHVSQQNTFTGKLTESMLDAVLARAVALAGPELRAARPA